MSRDTTPPLWFLRINPLRRSRLGDEPLRRHLERLAEAEREMRQLAERCSNELYDVIGGTADVPLRQRLVELRRSIHNDRPPQAGVPAPTPAVARWFDARQRREDIRQEVTRAYPHAAGRERAGLANLLADTDFQAALTLVAPEVHQEAERYRHAVAGDGVIPARLRKSERGLIQYVTRALLRTSPLSRFTAVGIGTPAEDGLSPGAVSFDHAVAFAGLDGVLLEYVLGGLDATAADEQAPESVHIGLAATSAVDTTTGTLFFLRSTESGLQRMSVPLSGPVRLLLDALTMGPRPIGSVVAHIAEKARYSPEKAAKLVHGALRQGLFCTFSGTQRCGRDLAELLNREHLPHLVEDIRAGLRALPAASVDQRRQRLASLRTNLDDLSRLARRPCQITVQEDYAVPPMRVRPQDWSRQLEDLGAAAELLSVFDWLHDVRVLMATAFVQRFGVGANVPLAEHADFLVGELSRRADTIGRLHREGGLPDGIAEVGPADGCLQRLYALRARLTEEMHTRITKTLQSGEGSVELSAAEVAGMTAGLPERFRREPVLYGTLVQQADEWLVLNEGLPGHGMLYARFLETDRHLGGQALPHLARRLTEHYGRDGCHVVEDLGLHGLNVNDHPPVLPHGLTPEDWFSLRLVHYPEEDMLGVEDSEGRRLRVLPLGAAHPGLFPAPLSVATGLVISGRLYNGFPDSWHEATSWDGGSTRVCPRMSVGTVLIARRRWYGGTELDTAMATGAGEVDRLLALTGWRGRHGVPAEVVVKTAPEQTGPMALATPDVQQRRLKHKPQYVDLTSALSTRVLPRMMRRRTADGDATVYFEEALPRVVEGTHASEWVVEVGRRPGGRLEYAGGCG